LNGGTLQNALDFAAFLTANEMVPEWVGNMWKIRHKGECVCHVWLDGAAEQPGPWTIWSQGDYAREPEGFHMDERMKEIARANVKICENCPAACTPKKRRAIFGKEFDNVCNAVMAFRNPDAEALECVKKVLEMKK